MCFPFAQGLKWPQLKPNAQPVACARSRRHAVNQQTLTLVYTYKQTHTYTPARSRENESTSDLLLGNEMIALTLQEAQAKSLALLLAV